MEFEPKEKEPILDVYFQSDFLSRRQGETFLLTKLYQSYYYSYHIRYEILPIWVIKPLAKFGKTQNVQIPEQETYTDLKKTNIEDLIIDIENEFDIYVFNESTLEHLYLPTLDLSSFKNLKKQLENTYGLRIEQEERTIKFVDVKLR